MVICFGHRRGESLQNKTKQNKKTRALCHQYTCKQNIKYIYIYRKGLLVKDEIDCNFASIKESLNISYL